MSENGGGRRTVLKYPALEQSMTVVIGSTVGCTSPVATKRQCSDDFLRLM